MHLRVDAMFDEEADPKKPHPLRDSHKREGTDERAESRKDEGRDGHRHVIVHC